MPLPLFPTIPINEPLLTSKFIFVKVKFFCLGKLKDKLSNLTFPLTVGKEILPLSISSDSELVFITSPNLSNPTFNSCILCHKLVNLKIGWVTNPEIILKAIN